MIEVKEWDDLKRLEEEVNDKRRTLDEAIAAIAKRFGVKPFVHGRRKKMPVRESLTEAWRDCEGEMMEGMDLEDQRQYQIKAVESGEAAARVVYGVKEAFGFELDYSVDSLLKVEEILRQMKDDISAADLALDFGSYLGQVLVRNGNGKWLRDDSDQCIVELPKGLRVSPMTKCYDYMEGKIAAAPAHAPIGYLSVWAHLVLAESRYKSQSSETVAASS